MTERAIQIMVSVYPTQKEADWAAKVSHVNHMGSRYHRQNGIVQTNLVKHFYRGRHQMENACRSLLVKHFFLVGFVPTEQEKGIAISRVMASKGYVYVDLECIYPPSIRWKP